MYESHGGHNFEGDRKRWRGDWSDYNGKDHTTWGLFGFCHQNDRIKSSQQRHSNYQKNNRVLNSQQAIQHDFLRVVNPKIIILIERLKQECHDQDDILLLWWT